MAKEVSTICPLVEGAVREAGHPTGEACFTNDYTLSNSLFTTVHPHYTGKENLLITTGSATYVYNSAGQNSGTKDANLNLLPLLDTGFTKADRFKPKH